MSWEYQQFLFFFPVGSGECFLIKLVSAHQVTEKHNDQTCGDNERYIDKN